MVNNNSHKKTHSVLFNDQTKKKKVNIIPLIDIIFLMLVFFMLATNFQENKEIEISVANASSKNIKETKTLKLFLKNNGMIEISNNSFSQKYIEDEIKNIWNQSGYSDILIICDTKSNSQNLITLMDSIKKLMITKVNFTIKNNVK